MNTNFIWENGTGNSCDAPNHDAAAAAFFRGMAGATVRDLEMSGLIKNAFIAAVQPRILKQTLMSGKRHAGVFEEEMRHQPVKAEEALNSENDLQRQRYDPACP